MPKPKKTESKQDYLKRCTGEVIAEGMDADQAYKMCNIYWDDNKQQRSILNLHLPVEFKKAGQNGEDGPRRFMMTAYTGQELETWWGKLVIAVDGMQAKQKIPILREHRRDRVVGFGSTSTDSDNFYVNGEFSGSTRDAKEVQNLADEGYPWQASVGVWPLKVKVLENAKASETVNGREITGPAEIWMQSDVGEVSFVSLGRDDDTAAISLMESEGKVPVNLEGSHGLSINETDNFNDKHESEVRMDKITLQILESDAPELLAQIREQAAGEAAEAARQDGIKAERERVIEILNADADGAETRKAIENGVDSNAAFKQFYEAEKAKRAAGLEDLKAEATPPAGTTEPENDEPATPKDPKQLRREWRPRLGPDARAA